MTWTGIAGLVIEDEDTSIGIDITFTKPQLTHWLLNKTFTSQEQLVIKKIQHFSLKNLKAIFNSHTHFDHVVDLPFLGHYFQATLYTSESFKILVESYNHLFNRKVKTKDLPSLTPIIIDNFKITAFPRRHPPILQRWNWHFLEGKILSKNSLQFYDYREGETWSYLIEHPKATIYFDQSGIPDRELLAQLPPPIVTGKQIGRAHV